MATVLNDNFALQYCVDRTASVRRFLDDGPLPDGPDRMWETLVVIALDFPALLRAAWRVAFDRLGGEGDFIPTRLVEDTRNGLLQAFAEVEAAMGVIREAVGDWQCRTGRSAARFERIAEATAEVRQLKEEIFRDWDSFLEPMEEPPGEPQPVMQAFAEMAGITEEELTRRIEEHKRKKKAMGWE